MATAPGGPAGALIEEASRRSGVVWLLPPGSGPGLPVWHLWHDGAAHLVAGGAEQPLPGVGDGDRVLVVVRSRARRADRVVQWWAVVRELVPGGAAWQAVVPLLHARRLNAADGEAQPARWARESRVLTLVPDGTTEPVGRPGAAPAGPVGAPEPAGSPRGGGAGGARPPTNLPA